MSTDVPNTKYAPVPMPVPRDPSAYRPGLHFAQRLKERVPDAIQDRVIRECIEEGHLSGGSPPSEVSHDEEMVQSFKFTKKIEGVRWTVVVAILRAPYLDDSAKHKVLTVYSPDAAGGDCDD